MRLHWQILIALALAVVFGSFTNALSEAFSFDLTAVYQFFGSLFLNALKMIIVPLIVSSIIVGISGMQNDHSFARMSGKTFIYYISTSTIAILIGLLMVSLFQPGLIDQMPAKDILGLHVNTNEVTVQVGAASAANLSDIFLRMMIMRI